MELTKMQKRLLAGVVVSLAGYVVDACFFGPPSTPAVASAAAVPDGNVPGKPAVAVSAPTTQRSERLGSFGAPGVERRLVATTQLATLKSLPSRDIFHPNGVARSSADLASDASAKPRSVPVDPAFEFLSRHKLRAVMLSGGQAVALINDRLLRVGQYVGGFKIISIENKAATLEKGGISVRLTLSDVGNLTDGSSH